MKAFLFDTLNRYKRYSENLDAKTTLCNKTWCVFNDSGEKEIYIFSEDGGLIVSINGIVTNAKWRYIPANKSLIISSEKQNVMLQPAFVDNVIFSLQMDGTDNYAFLIDESNKNNFQPKTLNDIKRYFSEIELAIQKKELEIQNYEKRQQALLAANEKVKQEAYLLKLRKEKDDEIKRVNDLEKVQKILSSDAYYIKLNNKLRLMDKRMKTIRGFMIFFVIITLSLIIIASVNQPVYSAELFIIAIVTVLIYGFWTLYYGSIWDKTIIKLSEYRQIIANRVCSENA